jgi:hypothetical protein
MSHFLFGVDYATYVETQVADSKRFVGMISDVRTTWDCAKCLRWSMKKLDDPAVILSRGLSRPRNF